MKDKDTAINSRYGEVKFKGNHSKHGATDTEPRDES